MRLKMIKLLLVPFCLLLFLKCIGCSRKSETITEETPRRIEVQELKGKFYIPGDKKFLSAFRKTVAVSENKLISWASYMDVSTGIGKNIHFLFDL